MTSAPSAEPLFSFVVVGDTHVNPRDDFSPSPWDTNRLANHRAEAVVAQINELKPDFVIHLGDMIHPLPGSPDFDQAAERFREIFGRLEMPLRLVPGNHDLGDKPTTWTPAAHVDETALSIYRKQFGDDFHAFDHAGCRFVIVNDEIINTGLADEEVQWKWLETELSRGQRTFVFTHYPPFLQAADEIEHYDNLAEPGRSRFADLVRDRAEALFCGHVHNFFYNRIGDTDFYVAPATSAIRHDYAEMFPLAPCANTEHGRDQRSKLGFFLVDVHEDSHVTHFVHSWGETDQSTARAATVRPVASAIAVPCPLGVDLRVGWADVHSVAYAGAVDEFNRKPVRNDYLVASLWELGMRHIRVPVRDVIDTVYAKRVEDLGARGHRFTLFSFGMPDAHACRKMAAVECVAALEITARMEDFDETARQAASFQASTGIPVYLSKLRLSADAVHDGNRFAHFIRHGFRLGEPDLESATKLVLKQGLCGLVFAVPRSDPASDSIAAIVAFAKEGAISSHVHVQLAGDNPAVEISEEPAISSRVIQSAEAAYAAPDRLRVYLDTFCDHDRGYFPRLGLVDRRYDLREPGSALKALVEKRSIELMQQNRSF